MAKMAIEWDQIGNRTYETGVDRGVLYPVSKDPETKGKYINGVAWNGLTSVSESPSGAEATALWADNTKYLNLMSAEEFAATIEAYTYPEEFKDCDGSKSIAKGVVIGQQSRSTFGLAYRTKVGNDVDGESYGYKIHLIYGCTASPSQKQYSTTNDSPSAITFSWEVKTTPVNVSAINGEEFKPTASLVIDSTNFTTVEEKKRLAALEAILYGEMNEDGQTVKTAPRLPLPDEIATIVNAAG